MYCTNRASKRDCPPPPPCQSGSLHAPCQARGVHARVHTSRADWCRRSNRRRRRRCCCRGRRWHKPLHSRDGCRRCRGRQRHNPARHGGKGVDIEGRQIACPARSMQGRCAGGGRATGRGVRAVASTSRRGVAVHAGPLSHPTVVPKSSPPPHLYENDRAGGPSGMTRCDATAPAASPRGRLSQHPLSNPPCDHGRHGHCNARDSR